MPQPKSVPKLSYRGTLTGRFIVLRESLSDLGVLYLGSCQRLGKVAIIMQRPTQLCCYEMVPEKHRSPLMVEIWKQRDFFRLVHTSHGWCVNDSFTL